MIEIYVALASAFLLTKYGVLPMGIIMGVIIIIFWDFLTLDQDNFKK